MALVCRHYDSLGPSCRSLRGFHIGGWMVARFRIDLVVDYAADIEHLRVVQRLLFRVGRDPVAHGEQWQLDRLVEIDAKPVWTHVATR